MSAPAFTQKWSPGWIVVNFLKKESLGLKRDLLIGVFAVIAFLAFIPVFTYFYFASDISDQKKIVSLNHRGVLLLDIHDRPFFNFYRAKVKEDVPLSDIPDHTLKAVVASEDREFFIHKGYSVKAIARSFVANILENDLSYGASTITQQLVKNSLLNSRKNFLRKYQEIVLASEIERRFKKEEILHMYLTTVYFGEGAFGIAEAADTYFGKPAKELDLAQSAMLAAILPAPSRFSPVSGDKEAAKVRQKIVLGKMVEQGYISHKQRDEALKQELEFITARNNVNNTAPHFALMIKEKLVAKYGEEALAASGFKVKTTLDLDWQKYAEKVVSDQVKKLSANRVTNGAAVVINSKTGEVKAMVGSRDWNDDSFGKINMAISKRPPGSAFKPIVYAAAFERGVITPAEILQDVPTKFRNDKNVSENNPNAFYSPNNYDLRFRGPVSVRRSLANSLNVTSVAVMEKVGVSNTLETARKLGITTLESEENYGLSLVLGTGDVNLLELTNVYAILANNGLKNDPALVLEIKDKEGRIIYKDNENTQRVLDEKDAFEITSILSDNSARQEVFGNMLTISRPAAVKTGTTGEFKDAWTFGYTPSLTVGVWIGNSNNRPMDNVAGSLGAAPIWRLLMEKFSAGTPKEEFKPPDGLIPLAVCPDGSVTEATSGAKVEYFKPDNVPSKKCVLQTPSPQPSFTPSPSPVQEPQTSQHEVNLDFRDIPGGGIEIFDTQTGEVVYRF